MTFNSIARVRRPSVTLDCPACDSPFRVEFNRTQRGKNVYCSKACAIAGTKTPLADRFWKYVNKTETCWLWTGKDTHPKGYGRIRLGGAGEGRIGAHGAAWMLASGQPVPEGYEVAHICDMPACVRNDDIGTYRIAGVDYLRFGHLVACPHAANEADKVAKGRHARGASNGRVLHPDSYPKGCEWPMAKLTDDNVRAIRRAYASMGATQVELAKQFGIRQATVSRIVLRQTWKHLD